LEESSGEFSGPASTSAEDEIESAALTLFTFNSRRENSNIKNKDKNKIV